jgi:hypothetical protein
VLVDRDDVKRHPDAAIPMCFAVNVETESLADAISTATPGKTLLVD